MSVSRLTARHPVLEVLHRRRERQDRPGDRADSYKVGLAIQGGGMRGVVSGAMLTALEDLGLHRAFDAIYGSSSGALNGAYFLGGNSWRRLPIYWDHLACSRFLDVRRIFGGDVLDLDYAFGTILKELEPLDYDAVLASDIPLGVAVTFVDELRTATVSDFRSAADLDAALRASSWLPIAVRGTTSFRGSRAIDGAVLEIHPHRLALADDCTHVLSLSTRPSGPLNSTVGLTQALLRWNLNRMHPRLGDAHARAARDYRRDRVRLDQWSRQPRDLPYVLDVAPLPWMREIRPFELDPGRLIIAARQAYEVMTRAVEGSGLSDLQSGRYSTILRFTSPKGHHHAAEG